MRILLILLVFMLLAGCSPKIQIVDFNITEIGPNQSIFKLQLHNDGKALSHCDLELAIAGMDQTQEYYLPVDLEPGEDVHVQMNVSFPEGDSNYTLKTNCE